MLRDRTDGKDTPALATSKSYDKRNQILLSESEEEMLKERKKELERTKKRTSTPGRIKSAATPGRMVTRASARK